MSLNLSPVRLIVATALLLCVGSSPAAVQVLAFEDAAFSGDGDLGISVENPGYGGLDWSSIAVVDVPVNISTTFAGWYVGVGCPLSGGTLCNGAYNLGGAITTGVEALGEAFTLESLFLTSSFGSQYVRLTGSLSGAPTYDSGAVALSATARTLLSPGAAMDQLTIRVVNSVGVAVASPTNPWVLDDMTISRPIPEPGTWALLAAGLGVLAFASRRRPPC